jgi:hypothetical protein
LSVWVLDPAFQVETLFDIQLLSLFLRLHVDAVDFGKTHFPAIFEIFAVLADQGFQPPEYLIACHVIPQLIRLYGEEVAMLWPLYLAMLASLFDSGLPLRFTEVAMGLYFLVSYVNTVRERVTELEVVLKQLYRCLQQTSNVEYQCEILQIFAVYARIVANAPRSLGSVARWILDRIHAISLDDKITSHSIEMLVRQSADILKVFTFGLERGMISRYAELALQSIDCQKNWRIRWFGLQLLCHFEKKTMSTPLDVFGKIVQILMEDVAENATMAAQFFFRFSVSRNSEFLAMGESLMEVCLQKLARVEGASALTDYLIGLLIQFPLSRDAITVVLAHFPVVNVCLVFAKVYSWVLQQFQENSEAIPVLLDSVLQFHCLNLERLVNKGKIGRDLQQQLTAVIEYHRGNTSELL